MKPTELIKVALQMAIKKIEDNQEKTTVTDLIAFSHTEAFNVKGQQLERLIAYILQKEFLSIDPTWTIDAINDMSDKDIMIHNQKTGEKYPFDCKNYKSDGIQISTEPELLRRYQAQFESFQEGPIANEDQIKLVKEFIGDLKESLLNKITLFLIEHSLRDKKNIEALVFFIDYDKLFENIDLERIQFIYRNKMSKDKKKPGATKHFVLTFPFKDSSSILEFKFGKNAFNRGAWLFNEFENISKNQTSPFISLLIKKTKNVENIKKNKKLMLETYLERMLEMINEYKL